MVETSIPAGAGVDLYARSIGSGEAIVIPLACWCEEFEDLGQKRRVILYDPRGRGRSSAVDIALVSFDNDVQDLETVRAHYGLERMALIGWSYFGGVVARYAMLHPERVTRLITVGGSPVRGGEFMAAAQAEQWRRLQALAPDLMREMSSGPPTPDTMRRFMDVFYASRSGQKPPWPRMRSRPSQFANEQPGRAAAVASRAMASMGDWDWREDARRIAAPFLVIDGEADILPQEACAEWVAAVPHAHAVVMPGVGHFPSFEDPDAFFEIVESFLGEVSATARPS